jgi:hypothetical protein
MCGNEVTCDSTDVWRMRGQRMTRPDEEDVPCENPDESLRLPRDQSMPDDPLKPRLTVSAISSSPDRRRSTAASPVLRVSLGLVIPRLTDSPAGHGYRGQRREQGHGGINAVEGRKVKVEVGQVGYYEGAPGSSVLPLFVAGTRDSLAIVNHHRHGKLALRIRPQL